MKSILILGGSQFIGRNLGERLLHEGQWELTLFNRQRTQPLLFPQVARILGDRETMDIEQLRNRDWDCVVDLSAYYPDSLERLLDVLRGRVKRYVFVSTLSVLQPDDDDGVLLDEQQPILLCDAAQRTDNLATSYGSRKAECERVLHEAQWLDKVILRPSVVFGKYDHTDRFYYWLYRAHQQLPVLLPDSGRDEITLTYVMDLVEVMIKALSIEHHDTVYNVTTHAPLTLRALLNEMPESVKTVSYDAAELLKKGIRPGHDIPLWFGTSFKVSNAKLKRDFDLSLTPLKHSIAETARYYEALGWPEPKVGRGSFDLELPD